MNNQSFAFIGLAIIVLALSVPGALLVWAGLIGFGIAWTILRAFLTRG